MCLFLIRICTMTTTTTTGGSQEFITLSRSASSSPELLGSLKQVRNFSFQLPKIRLTKSRNDIQAPNLLQRSGCSSAGGRKTPNTLLSGTKSPKRCDLETNTFIQQCLQAHNEYRSKHKVPPLTLNKKVPISYVHST